MGTAMLVPIEPQNQSARTALGRGAYFFLAARYGVPHCLFFVKAVMLIAIPGESSSALPLARWVENLTALKKKEESG